MLLFSLCYLPFYDVRGQSYKKRTLIKKNKKGWTSFFLCLDKQIELKAKVSLVLWNEPHISRHELITTMQHLLLTNFEEMLDQDPPNLGLSWMFHNYLQLKEFEILLGVELKLHFLIDLLSTMSRHIGKVFRVATH